MISRMCWIVCRILFLELVKTYEVFLTLSEEKQKSYLMTICIRSAYRINEKNYWSKIKEYEDLTSDEEHALACFDYYSCEMEETKPKASLLLRSQPTG